jgi:hypothetical protein
MKRRHVGPWALTLGIFELACIIPAEDVGILTSATDDASGGASSGGTSGEATNGAASQPETGGSGSDGGSVPSACGPDGPPCEADQDHDCVGLDGDNAPDVYNPDQRDLDEDGIADAVDLCPLVPSAEQADSDHDGLGNACDPCRRVASGYDAVDVPVPGYMLVRNVPSTADADGDGIGDVCDNCIHVPNCESYGPAASWQPGDPIADGDGSLCQQADGDGIGDACQGLPPLPGAAGLVGLGADDDFDQDGLVNEIDGCPRSPLNDAIACVDDDDCPQGRQCEPAAGLCDHVDVDADDVGDICDSCPSVVNPLQVGEIPLDDSDGDFRGDACELGEACATARDPARFAFYPVSASGWCCTVSYRGDDVHIDPNGLPLRVDCSAEQEAAYECRRIPPQLVVVPGILALPIGCEAALADAGLTVDTNVALEPGDVGGIEELWPYACKLPPLDQDFDGLGDACDLCEFAFDPENLPYIDANGMVWPNDGKYCNGDYAIDNICMVG